jgi:hypothetical protein
MVASGNRHGVKVFIIKRLANVLKALGGIPGHVFNPGDAGFEQAAVRIDQVSDLDAVHAGEFPDMRSATAMDSGYTDSHRVVGTEHFPRRLCARHRKQRKSCAGRDRSFKESPAIKLGHAGLLVEAE